MRFKHLHWTVWDFITNVNHFIMCIILVKHIILNKPVCHHVTVTQFNKWEKAFECLKNNNKKNTSSPIK